MEGLSIIEAASLLTNPFEDRIRGNLLLETLSQYRGAKLDGPFAIVVGFEDEYDTYLVALTDRSKFRPLLFGEDENRYFVASEENQIRTISPHASVWTPEPGSFFVASLKRGLISSGTRRKSASGLAPTNYSLRDEPMEISKASKDSTEWIDSTEMPFQEINSKIQQAYSSGKEKISFDNLSGQRYIGIGFTARKDSARFRIELSGFPGNCLANLNDGAHFEVFGNVSDDLGDTMHSGKIVIHGSARDVVGQALQGGEIFVRGSVGNRAAIQMREYKNHRPFLVVGEMADDYLGEYMAGGVVVVLNLSGEARSVGNYIGTGMVGGRIYIRGRVDEAQIGLPPKKADILSYLKAFEIDGTISRETFASISRLEFPTERILGNHLPPEVFKRVRNLFFRGKYTKPVLVEFRKLDQRHDGIIALEPKIRSFFDHFNIPSNVRESLLDSEFTVIQTVEEEEKETPIPPQEVPVEE
ncbi:MAG: hypothetical protein OK457_05310 [Thaumarchaeota archaeon]|nr:hypothetical protein [Nitrososphaerota archaeon]